MIAEGADICLEGLQRILGTVDGLDERSPQDVGGTARSPSRTRSLLAEWKRARLEYLVAKVRHRTLKDLALELAKSSSGNKDRRIGNLLLSMDGGDPAVQQLDVEDGKSLGPWPDFLRQAETRVAGILGVLAKHYNPVGGDLDVDKLESRIEEDAAAVAAIRLRSGAELTGSSTTAASTLKDTANTLEKIVREHVGRRMRAEVQTKTEYSEVKARTLDLKFRCVEAERVALSHTREVILMLKSVRKQTDEEMDRVRQEAAALGLELAGYEAAVAGSPEFLELVDEYGRLQEEIRGKWWALDQFTKSRNNF